MPLYKTPEERASETVTIRLTQREKALLDHLAHLEEKTLTDLLRDLIARHAEVLQVVEVPEVPRKRRPGRPKKKRPAEVAIDSVPRAPAPSVPAPSVPTPTAPSVPTPSVPTPSVPAASIPAPTAPSVPAPSVPAPAPSVPAPAPSIPPSQAAHRQALISSNPVRSLLYQEAEEKARADTFYDLVVRFHKSFAHRAEGTKKELEDTIEFLCFGGESAIIPPETPLGTLTAERLQEIRKFIQVAELRFAKKNLHLTYLRMMLHFGVKERDIDYHVNPSGVLEPLTITESNEGWRFFTGQ